METTPDWRKRILEMAKELQEKMDKDMAVSRVIDQETMSLIYRIIGFIQSLEL